jgi:hypothetical protein
MSTRGDTAWKAAVVRKTMTISTRRGLDTLLQLARKADQKEAGAWKWPVSGR